MTMTMTIEHHGVEFTIDTSDWSDNDAAQRCQDLIADRLLTLTVQQVERIADTWRNPCLEAQSRNDGCPVAQMVTAIERAAYDDATRDWHRRPDSGHNACLSPMYYPWRVVRPANYVDFGTFRGVSARGALEHMIDVTGYSTSGALDVYPAQTPIWEVPADHETGEWLAEPHRTDDTTCLADWHRMQDSDAVHYDTYEHIERGCKPDTRPIRVIWQ